MKPPGWAARAGLPSFPWDSLAPYAEKARAHPGGLVDLSVGTPVDATPALVADALAAAADSPGYPMTIGTPALRQAIVDWAGRTLGASLGPENVMPSIGSKELVGLLPCLLGLSPGTQVLLPRLAYPTYDVGARLAGCVPVPTDDPTGHDPAQVSLVWLNSPSNPTGRVAPAAETAAVLAWGRRHGILVASDECYFELDFTAAPDPVPVSALHPSICGDSVAGLLVLHSLSKRSNLAGYRAGLALGDAAVLEVLVAIRKHLGLLTPAPVQAAAVAALRDDGHVADQHARYLARRQLLLPALAAAGLRVEHSQAGLYLWATRDESCWDTVGWLAEHGVLAAPGVFYGQAGARHVRIALTADDERIAAAAGRLVSAGTSRPR